MSNKYEKMYQKQKHALGDPTQAFVQFFENYPREQADVLDLGCGQGRDALFIARHGHHVVGVDIAKTGIEQLRKDAKSEGLDIQAEVADLIDYQPIEYYDIIVIDRTLHMLAEDVRTKVLERIIQHVRDEGFVLIADEKKNLPSFKAVFSQDGPHWTTIKNSKGFLFTQKHEHDD